MLRSEQWDWISYTETVNDKSLRYGLEPSEIKGSTSQEAGLNTTELKDSIQLIHPQSALSEMIMPFCSRVLMLIWMPERSFTNDKVTLVE